MPRRPDTEQREDLGHVVALCAHRGGAPGDEADHPRQRAGLGPLAVEQRVGEPPADLPRQLRGQGARVDAVEVAPGREHVDAPAGRRARRARRDVAAAQGARATLGQLVGRAQDPRDDLVAGEAQRALDAGVGSPRTSVHTSAAALARPVAGGERVEQRHVRVLEAVDEVARAGVRAAEALHEAVRRLLHRRAARRHQRRLVESEGRADGAAQTRHVARAEPQHGRHEPAQLIASRRAAEHVQAVLDLDVLDLAQVAVDVLDELADVLGPLVDVEVGLQVGALDRRPDARSEAGQLGRVEHLQARVLVEQRLQLGHLVVGVGAHHRRDEVVDDRRRGRGAWPARPPRGR